jgi:hypothetical protein
MWEWLHPSNPDPFMEMICGRDSFLQFFNSLALRFIFCFGFILLARLLSWWTRFRLATSTMK